jgi:predicted nuclease of predicted toxin-antitoxin system
MKLLLDECIDRRLAKELSGHEVKTAPQMGWAGIKMVNF